MKTCGRSIQILGNNSELFQSFRRFEFVFFILHLQIHFAVFFTFSAVFKFNIFLGWWRWHWRGREWRIVCLLSFLNLAEILFASCPKNFATGRTLQNDVWSVDISMSNEKKKHEDRWHCPLLHAASENSGLRCLDFQVGQLFLYKLKEWALLSFIAKLKLISDSYKWSSSTAIKKNLFISSAQIIHAFFCAICLKFLQILWRFQNWCTYLSGSSIPCSGMNAEF